MSTTKDDIRTKAQISLLHNNTVWQGTHVETRDSTFSTRVLSRAHTCMHLLEFKSDLLVLSINCNFEIGFVTTWNCNLGENHFLGLCRFKIWLDIGQVHSYLSGYLFKGPYQMKTSMVCTCSGLWKKTVTSEYVSTISCKS